MGTWHFSDPGNLWNSKQLSCPFQPCPSSPSSSSALAPSTFWFPWPQTASWLWAACPSLCCSNHRLHSQISCSFQAPSKPRSVTATQISCSPCLHAISPTSEWTPRSTLLYSLLLLPCLVLVFPCTLYPCSVIYSSSFCSWNLPSAGKPVSDG